MDAMRYISFDGTKVPQVADSGSVYLSFLPDLSSILLPGGLHYRFYELEHLVVYELWGGMSDDAVRLELLPKEIGFWQIYQLVGTTWLYIPHSLELGESRCLSLASRREKIVLQLRPDAVRLFIVGYKRKGLAPLLEEYPSLDELCAFEKDPSRLDLLLPDIGVNYRFRQILLQISGLTYRPFHTRYELGIQLGQLFNELVHALQKDKEAGARSQLGLYHQALDYIRQHFTEDINKESIANALHVSSRTLNRAFEGRRIKIADYIQRLKLNKARDMLYQGEMTVEEVAYALNYPNRKYFSREFKKYFFDNPSAIKKLSDWE